MSGRVGRGTGVRAVERLLQALDDSNITEASRLLLKPLTDYDSQHSGDLVHTLRTYLAANGNASRTAEVLFLHRNGLLYRLGRIEELLRVNLSHPETRMALEIATYVLST
jgi:PucR family transcriptional regulator, purine catabolism regulatory protein